MTPEQAASKSIYGTDSLKSVRYFLDSIGWSGSDRRFFEAQPYLDPVNEMNALRSFLFKLDFTTTLSDAKKTRLRSAFLPCFLLDESRRLYVIRDLDEAGNCTVFDPETEQETTSRQTDLRGTFVFPEQKQDHSASARGRKWTELALATFGKDLRMIFIVSLKI